MDSWQTIAIAILTPTNIGGVWATLRWWMNRKDRQAKESRDHEIAMMQRWEALQERFLKALEARDARIDQEREARLKDRAEHADTLLELAKEFREAAQAVRSERPPALPPHQAPRVRYPSSR